MNDDDFWQAIMSGDVERQADAMVWAVDSKRRVLVIAALQTQFARGAQAGRQVEQRDLLEHAPAPTSVDRITLH